VPYSIGLHIADGFLAKTDKSKALLHIVKDIDDSDLSVNPRDRMITDNGNAIKSFYDPFSIVENDTLHCISSRAPAPANVSQSTGNSTFLWGT